MPTERIRHLLRLQVALLAVFWVSFAFGANTQVVVVPVANMYSGPNDQTDVVSQVIYGSNVTLLTERGEWSRIQTDDHYRGWVRSRHLRVLLTGSGYAISGVVVQVESVFANVYHEPDVTRHQPVVTIPFQSRLEVIPDNESAEKEANGDSKKPKVTKKAEAKKHAANPVPDGWLHVRLPDKRVEWIQLGDVTADIKPLTIPESVELAKRFLGFPYLWGGTSSFGFDCSGFTQMLVRSRGIVMPRDADKQAAWSGVAKIDRKDLQPGDLLFFGSSPRNITHTGMFIGDGQFIHDTTNTHPVVQISRLDDEPWTKLLVASRRVK